MELPSLMNFSLVGGTALSLRYGHRSSIDLDLFFHEKFTHETIISELENEFGDDFDYKKLHTHFGIFCFLKNVKVDLVYFPHLPIETFYIEEKIRFYSKADIAAMKIQAILGRAKKKVFWDLHELLQHFSLQQLMDWHKQKYPNQMLAISIPHAITYFADADESEAPVSFKGQTWEKIKKDLSKIVSDYLR
ncbi:MAG: nucleotidyl transferase AbiEii/AbiGii toxin family protein [Bacteroidales bacterium]|nr:nucleotidyl transferase AbiEii/AbiGii toxin family protein [Bacteroidales bacterium]MCF8456154.1 nucleotidyl transferase AbiEii/AbiGii toxin family protein [Bacteroidales bacterium]